MEAPGDFCIDQVVVGEQHDVFMIAEVGNAHDGSYNMAHAFVDAVAGTGVQAIKFQTHIAAAESTPAEPFRVNFSYTDKTRMDYWRRLEFSSAQWRSLKEHAEEVGLIFLSSPFSPDAVQLLQEIGVAAWKVASGETNNLPLLEMMLQTGKPLLISTGMSYWQEIDQCVALCRQSNTPFLLFHCTTAYPCPPEKVGLNILAEMRQRYNCPVGLSDHSGDIFASLAAVTLGARAVEVHICLSRDAFGPDVPASLTPQELKRLVQGVRAIHCMQQHPCDKDAMAREKEGVRRLFCKSIVLKQDLPAGTRLQACHLSAKKPGSGIPVAQINKVIGRVLSRPVTQDYLLGWEDLEPLQDDCGVEGNKSGKG